MQEVQTTEELVCQLRSTRDELIERLKNYHLMSDVLEDESRNEGLALAVRVERMLYDGMISVAMTKKRLTGC